MPTRPGRLAGLLTVSAVALLGLLTLPPGVLAAYVFIAVSIGPPVAWSVYSTTAQDVAGGRVRRALRAGAAVSVGLLGTCLVVAGSVVLLGPFGAVLLIMLTAAAAVVWWRRRHAAPGPDPVPTTRPAPPRPAPVDRPRGAGPRLPDVDTATSTLDLCAAWRRTYWLLQDVATAGPEHVAVIDLRVRLLDEFERRDPDGLARWLLTEPRAGSDPGRHLTPDH